MLCYLPKCPHPPPTHTHRVGGNCWQSQEECQTLNELASSSIHSSNAMQCFRPRPQPRRGRVEMEVFVPTLTLPAWRGDGSLGMRPALCPLPCPPGLSLRRAPLKGRAEAGELRGPFYWGQGNRGLQREKQFVCTLHCQLCLSVARTQSGPCITGPLPHTPAHTFHTGYQPKGPRGPGFPKDAKWRPQEECGR